ncbi:MAG: hypothetical protein ACRD08_02520 [Acidimicrobiales bacterium]|jgi:hypothetical protein
MSFLGFHRHGESGEDDSRPPEAHPRWEAALTGETEAFLEGRIVEHLVAAGRVVPTWAVLNKLAHASPTELADLAETDGIPGTTTLPREPAYRAAQRSLACRLLACGAVPEEITRIQQTVLVPLELRLIERSEVETVTLRQAVRGACDALDHGGFTG